MPTDSSPTLDTAPANKLETPPEPSTGPKRYSFSIDDTYQIAETGIFRGKRVELIGGQFLVKEPPSSFHAGMVKRLINRLGSIIGSDAIISAQDPVVLSRYDMPQPDIALLKPHDDFYTSEHPGPDDVYLAVEVSNTSLAHDQSTKATLYAAAGIQTYWIVDVNAKVVHVHEDPAPEGYGNVRTAERGATLNVPGPVSAVISVDELFPSDSSEATPS